MLNVVLFFASIAVFSFITCFAISNANNSSFTSFVMIFQACLISWFGADMWLLGRDRSDLKHLTEEIATLHRQLVVSEMLNFQREQCIKKLKLKLIKYSLAASNSCTF